MPNDYADIPASAQSTADIPNPVRPLVRHNGWVMPYRGQAAHGVDPNATPPNPVPDLFDQAQVPIAPEKAPERAEVPVPVKIVSEGSKENKEWLTGQEVAGATPSMIASRNEARTSLEIKNIGTVRVWCGSDNRTSKASGYPLDQGQTLSLSGWGAVYAMSDDGSNQTLAIVAEYVVER